MTLNGYKTFFKPLIRFFNMWTAVTWTRLLKTGNHTMPSYTT